MDHRELKDTALLIGYDSEGACVYSAQMPLVDYWNGDHPWDTDDGVRGLRLVKVRGYLFGESGDQLQEFETIFDSQTGLYKSSWAKHSDGTFREHAA
jgi:hypothetical protein